MLGESLEEHLRRLFSSSTGRDDKARFALIRYLIWIPLLIDKPIESFVSVLVSLLKLIDEDL